MSSPLDAVASPPIVIAKEIIARLTDFHRARADWFDSRDVVVMPFAVLVKVVLPLSDLQCLDRDALLSVGGRVDYGAAFRSVRERIGQDASATTGGSLRPVVILITGGCVPTDAVAA